MSSRFLRVTLSGILALSLFGALAFGQADPASARGQNFSTPLGSTGASQTNGQGQTPSAGQSSIPPGSADAGISAKDEIVYATLNVDGTLRDAYVVNHFDITEAGRLVDRGSYSEVSNLSTTVALAQDGDVITGKVDVGDFYYEGTLSDARLPWSIAIAYSLDGKPINASELGGATGQLEVRIITRANPGVNPLFFDNYMLQIQLSLNTEKACEIVAPDATIAQAGSARQVAFTVLPGREADLRLSARVTDFEMDAIQISALPFSMAFDLPDTSEMADGLGLISDAIGQINGGAAALNAGISDMSAGGLQLARGSQEFNDGLLALSAGSAQLREGSAQFYQLFNSLATQIRGAYDQLVNGLGDMGIDLDELMENLASLEQILTDLDSLMEQIESARTTIDAAIGTINDFVAGFQGLDEATISQLQSEAAALDEQQLSAASQSALTTLIADYRLSQGLVNNWDTLRPLLEGLSQGLGSLDTDDLLQVVSALQAMLAEVQGSLGDISSLEDLVVLVEQLADGYGQFDDGLIAYTDGVDGLAGGFVGLNGGIQQFVGGVAQVQGGTAQLYDGTSQLYGSVVDLPATMTEQIEVFMADYDFSDFVPESFTSSENRKVELVQFVLMTEPIKAAEPETAPEAPAAPATFWDRLLALFGL
ncbi:MAG: hypothetical protein LBI64_03235 [Coriobacteriales bacterium]|jgi:X-X-X-Leu-X-X-Gly heptad repeat protein|nr:hypothetical protein [Coriobacteriales bacterium]